METSTIMGVTGTVLAVIAIVVAVPALILPPAIGVGAIGSAEIADNSLVLDDLSTSLAEVITGLENIDDNSITGDKIVDDNITADDLAADSVGSSEIASDAVGSDEIADDAVGSSEIATDAVGSDEIADDAVTTTEILDGTITTGDIADGAVTYADMAIKIKCGIAEVVSGSTVTHGLGQTPTSIVATPVQTDNHYFSPGDIVLYVNIDNVTTNTFDVALWVEVEYTGITPMPTFLNKVGPGTEWNQEESMYWIAIYDPNA